MVNTEQVQNRRMEVVRIRRVLGGLERQFIALAIRDTRFYARTPDPAPSSPAA